MALVTTKVLVGQKPTKKQLAEVERAASFTIVYNEDSPESSDNAIIEFTELAKARQESKTIVTLPVSEESISVLKSFNKNYVKAISSILDYVTNNPKTLAKMLS
jgi:5-bromo-4-chloroindolyl phosphate hydrolysis protein